MVIERSQRVGKMRKRYQVEERNKELEPEQKAEQGKRLSPPVPDDLHAWNLTPISSVYHSASRLLIRSRRSRRCCRGRPFFRHDDHGFRVVCGSPIR